MATTEYTGVFKKVDDDGNEILLYPDVKTDTSLSESGKAADAAAVGTQFTAVNQVTGSFIGSTTIAAGSSTATINNAAITADSIIDIYYSEDSKEVAVEAGVSYYQEAGSLTITFGAELSAAVTISNIKVVNA